MLDAGGRSGANRAGDRCQAESLHATVRLITSPLAGTFLPAERPPSPNGHGASEHLELAEGDEIGVVVRSGERRPVHSPFAGRWMGLLVLPGERVRPHQPLAWITTSTPENGVRGGC